MSTSVVRREDIYVATHHYASGQAWNFTLKPQLWPARHSLAGDLFGQVPRDPVEPARNPAKVGTERIHNK